MLGLSWMRSSVAVMILMVVSVGCGTSAKPPPVQSVEPSPSAQPEQDTGRMLFDCQPQTARVIVDGQDQGTVEQISAQGGLKLPRGLHRVEVVHDGYQTFRFELILGEKAETIKVQLEPAAGERIP
jgi:hypothetical protein